MPRKPADTARQFVALSRRSTLAIFRQPALVGPSLIFPLFFAALGSSAFSRAISLPGFPQVDSYLQFTLAGTVTQGVLFGSVTGAAALATDIENGFLDRLLAAPTPRTGILIGRLAGSRPLKQAATSRHGGLCRLRDSGCRGRSRRSRDRGGDSGSGGSRRRGCCRGRGGRARRRGRRPRCWRRGRRLGG